MSSFYNRREEGRDTIFHVTPAPYPGEAVPNLLFWGGVFLIVCGLPLMIVLVGFLFVIIGVIAVLQGRKRKRLWQAENASRQPRNIRVDAAGVTVVSHTYGAADIVEFSVTHQSAGPATVRYERITTAGGAIGASLRDNTENAQAHVSYQASLRLRSDSRPIVLMSGLTEQTASALIQDLSDALTRARQAAEADA